MDGTSLEPDSWEGKCVHSESTLHQLSPFLGKMKSSMAGELIRVNSEQGDTVLDPFCGSGTVPLEAAINKREVIGIDRNPYSYLLTEAKLNHPETEDMAISKAERYLASVNPKIEEIPNPVPDWVRKFFHPKTLSGLIQLFSLPKLRRFTP